MDLWIRCHLLYHQSYQTLTSWHNLTSCFNINASKLWFTLQKKAKLTVLLKILQYFYICFTATSTYLHLYYLSIKNLMIMKESLIVINDNVISYLLLLIVYVRSLTWLIVTMYRRNELFLNLNLTELTENIENRQML